MLSFHFSTISPNLTKVCFLPQRANTADLASGAQNFHCLCFMQPWKPSDSACPLPVITKNMHLANWWTEIWGAKCGHRTELKEVIIQRNLFFVKLSISAVQTLSRRYISHHAFKFFQLISLWKIHQKWINYRILSWSWDCSPSALPVSVPTLPYPRLQLKKSR